MPSVQRLFRVARRIYAVYEQRRVQRDNEKQAAWNHVQERFEQAQRQRLLVEKARARGWHLAADWQQQRLGSVLRGIHEALGQTHEILRPAPRTPCLKRLVAELQHLEMEFDDVILDPKKSFLAVETQPIVLEEINLGRFSLRLVHQRNVTCFEVVALDPNTAGDDENVPHPHVRDGQLCAGEATLPLQKALEEGLLTDAFHMMGSVMETFNRESAYRSLDQWDGFSCWSCGSSSDRDES